MKDENSKKSKVCLRKCRFSIFFFLFEFVELCLLSTLCWLLKHSWPKTLVKKWFNIKSKAEDFHADEDIVYRGDCLPLIFCILHTNLI